jgi:hypothetical protein
VYADTVYRCDSYTMISACLCVPVNLAVQEQMGRLWVKANSGESLYNSISKHILYLMVHSCKVSLVGGQGKRIKL